MGNSRSVQASVSPECEKYKSDFFDLPFEYTSIEPTEAQQQFCRKRWHYMTKNAFALHSCALIEEGEISDSKLIAVSSAADSFYTILGKWYSECDLLFVDSKAFKDCFYINLVSLILSDKDDQEFLGMIKKFATLYAEYCERIDYVYIGEALVSSLSDTLHEQEQAQLDESFHALYSRFYRSIARVMGPLHPKCQSRGSSSTTLPELW